MKWYHYFTYFFGGVFLVNSVPHFTNGVSGRSFPTPFASPPGQGLSPAWVNPSDKQAREAAAKAFSEIF